MEPGLVLARLIIMEKFGEPAKAMKQTLMALKARYYEMGKNLGAPRQYLRFAETPQNNGHPHIEYEGTQLVYVVTERGDRFRERRTSDPDELLYWLVSDFTREMASDHERINRIEVEDSRRQLFAKHLALLDSINPEWAKRKRAEYDKVLLRNPYQDPTP